MRTPFHPTWHFLLLGATCFAGASGDAVASIVERVDLKDLLVRSDLIFEGVVVAVDHKTSEVLDANDAKLPHTFVTFSIENLVKGGSSAGSSITLRFMGGPDEKGRILDVAGIPNFQIGDREMLFVRNNGTSMCPLVGWEQGRLRIVRGNVFDGSGRELWFTPQGRLVGGEGRLDLSKPGYPEVPAAPSDGEKGKQDVGFEPPVGSIRPDASGLGAVLGIQLDALRVTGDVPEVEPVQSADRSASFRVARLMPSKAPIDPRPAVATIKSERKSAVDPDAEPDGR